VTHSSPYTTLPPEEDPEPLRNLYLEYLGEALCAAVIRFCLDYKAIFKGKSHNCCSAPPPELSSPSHSFNSASFPTTSRRSAVTT
jgi:hypothetical protein